jgi:hypothetical protein
VLETEAEYEVPEWNDEGVELVVNQFTVPPSLAAALNTTVPEPHEVPFVTVMEGICVTVPETATF